MIRQGIRFLVLLFFLLSAGCIQDGAARIAAEHFSIDTVVKDAPGESYAGTILKKIAEGDVSRRVIGWKDRST